MRNIYQAAERVLVWLGNACPETEAAMSWVHSQLEKHGEDLDLLQGVVNLYMECWPESGQELADDSFPSQTPEVQDRRFQRLRGFTILLSQPWWSRIWVVQEVVVNRNVNIVCGRSVVPWGPFMAIVKGLHHSAPLLQATPNERDVFGRSILREISRRNYHAYFVPPTMSDLLSHHRGLQASDLRDHVYALLDISSDMSTSTFVPDYSRSAEEVFRRLVKKDVEEHRDLNIICASEPSATLNTTLPSWVPDWSSPWKHFCLTQFPFDVCDEIPAHASFSSDMSILKATGITLAIISSTSAPLEPSDPVFTAWLQTAQEWRTIVEEDEFDTFFCTQFRRVFEMIVVESESEEDGPAEEIRKVKEGVSSTRLLSFENFMGRICTNRRLACLKRDDEVLEGLVPIDAIAGDRIVVLFGCTVPVVLRGGMGGMGGWRFVGDAYVNGYMYGKAVEGLTNDDAEEFAIR